MKIRVFAAVILIAFLIAGCAREEGALGPTRHTTGTTVPVSGRTVLGPLRILTSGETVTGNFELEQLPRMPLLLMVEVTSDEERALPAEVMMNGDPVLTADDLSPESRVVRREILPDLLRLGENTIEARAGSGEGDEVALVVRVLVQ